MKILVIGDAMSDLYYYGASVRLSPEAPVPVVAVSRTETRGGGAANVANNIEAMGVPCERIFGGPERIQKIRLLSGKQHVARIDFDHPQAPIKPDAAFEEALGRCNIVVAVDYGKGSLADIESLIACASRHNRPVFVDPKGHEYGRYRGAALIKPNRLEMHELFGGWSSQDELDFKARQFLHTCGIESILLTQSEAGMTFYTRSATLRLASVARDVVDVSGAGEAALSAFAASIAKGKSVQEAAVFANKAAGLAVGRFGTAILTEGEVFGTG